jgi:hypothetical protein
MLQDMTGTAQALSLWLLKDRPMQASQQMPKQAAAAGLPSVEQ